MISYVWAIAAGLVILVDVFVFSGARPDAVEITLYCMAWAILEAVWQIRKDVDKLVR